MMGLIQKNSDGAISTVFYSVIGSIGLVYLISMIVAYQPQGGNQPFEIFKDYFIGGQIGLTILSISGAIFAALLHRPPMPKWLSGLLYALFFVPVILTGIIIGLNPGFAPGGLGVNNLWLLWTFFVILHVLWFILLLVEPEIKSAQEAGKEEKDRVTGIIEGGKSE